MAYKKGNQKSVRELLDEQIKSGSIGRAYTFYGEEEYLKKLYADRLAEKLLGKDYDDFSYITLDTETYSFDAFADSVENMSFISQGKFIYLRDLTVEQIKEDFELIKDALSRADESVTAVFYFNADFLASKDFGKNKKRKDAILSMSAFSQVLEFERMSPTELSKWACKLAYKLGTSMQESTGIYLCERCAFDMGKIKNEVTKLASYKVQGVIERTDVDLVTSPSVEADVFALSKNIMDTAPQKVMATIDNYKKNKESPALILYNLSAAFYEMCAAKAAIMSGIYDEGALVTELGISKSKSYYLKNYLRICKDVPLSFFSRVLEEAVKCDKAFKEGEGESWERIEALCLKAVHLLSEEKRKSDRWL